MNKIKAAVVLIINSIILAAMVTMMCNQKTYNAGYICPECEVSCKISERAYITTLHPEGEDYIDTTYQCPQCGKEYHS